MHSPLKGTSSTENRDSVPRLGPYAHADAWPAWDCKVRADSW